MSASDELFQLILGRTTTKAVERILAAGYSKPRTITTVDELDALPNGSVVLSQVYRHYLNGMDISFQRWEDGLWHRGARSTDTHPDNFLPVTVIHEPTA
jgi:hypothetical protein